MMTKRTELYKSMMKTRRSLRDVQYATDDFAEGEGMMMVERVEDETIATEEKRSITSMAGRYCRMCCIGLGVLLVAYFVVAMVAVVLLGEYDIFNTTPTTPKKRAGARPRGKRLAPPHLKTVASILNDGPDDISAFKLAANGDKLAVISDKHEHGTAYVFTRSDESSKWTQQAKLTVSDNATVSDLSSDSVAIVGDTLLIAASRKKGRGRYAPEIASVYVFTRSGDTWSEQAKLTASDGNANGIFGSSVAISGGDTLIIWSDDLDDYGNLIGSTYIFTRSGSTWTEQGKFAFMGLDEK